MANRYHKLWYRFRDTKKIGEQLELFPETNNWIGPMYVSAEDSEKALDTIYNMNRPELEPRVTGEFKWDSENNRWR